MKKKQNKIQSVPIDSLIENPNNPNKMSKKTFAKLVRNIERTGLYEPLIVRKANSDPQYEIINGYQRVRALKQLGYTTVDVCVWDVDEPHMDILLATVNNLRGTPVLEKKLALINRLNDKMQAKELSEILPLTSGQIERYCSLELPKAPTKKDTENLPHPIIFFVDKKQKQTIDKAIHIMQNTASKSSSRRTKAEAITEIAETFNKKNKAV